MDAGRELDTLVAEKVMGVTVVSRDWPCGFHPSGEGYVAAASPERPPDFMRDRGPVYMPEGPYAEMTPLPFYSTEMDAAWCVVTAMQARSWQNNLQLMVYAYARTYACFGLAGSLDEMSEGNGEYATPLAICLAALAAVGKE